ncbi:hypothetical protein MTP99_005313 [Tenebrio molitor]|jgi:hypothetical protein|nr:hypothetical protein MTP99_005313 [Tenebrio molitor]
MFHGCQIQKKYNKAIREGRFREIRGDRRRYEEDSEDLTSRYGGDSGRFRTGGSWQIQEDPVWDVHGRNWEICGKCGVLRGEMGRFGKDTRRSREDTGRFGGDIRRSERCGMRILENYRKIRENPVKNLVHDRYRKIRAERSTEDTRSFMDKTGRFGGDTGRHWRYKRDTRSFMGDTGRTEEDIGKFGMDICGKYTEI